MLNELKKFGKIISFTFPTLNDLKKTSTIKESALGKAFVEFEEVASAFVCFNMLNDRVFLNQQVVIEFFTKDAYITQSLFWTLKGNEHFKKTLNLVIQSYSILIQN